MLNKVSILSVAKVSPFPEGRGNVEEYFHIMHDLEQKDKLLMLNNVNMLEI